jgi:hypothetical protein
MTILGNGNPTEQDLLNFAEELKLSLTKCKNIINKIKETIKEEIKN